jgi:hypothetical protein
MYPARVYPEGYTYLQCILMYLKCILNALLHSKRIHVSWHFACILHVSQTSLRYISDTHKIHQDTCILCASLMSHWIHIRIYASGYMYLGLFVTIHQDTPRYKITIHVSWTRHDDTSRYIIRIHKGYIRDTCGIHAGYM